MFTGAYFFFSSTVKMIEIRITIRYQPACFLAMINKLSNILYFVLF